MPDYSQGKIYKLVCNITGQIYIGSTVKTLNRRLAQHKADYQRYLKGIVRYISSFEIIKSSDYQIILIEYFPCQFRNQLENREGFHIKSNQCVNKVGAGEICRKEKKKIQNQKLSQIIIKCFCGQNCTYKHKSRHEKTQFHQRNAKIYLDWLTDFNL